MGKKLVIKGADFSANGFHFEIVKKEVTKLVKKDGSEVSQGDTIDKADSVYYYEQANKGYLAAGSNFGGAVSTSSSFAAGGAVDIDVEDYTDAEVTSTLVIPGQSSIAGVAIMFFLDSSKNIIGGFSTGDSVKGCQNVGASDTERTFSMKIPARSKYVVCTVCQLSGVVPYFKLTLSKKVVY